MTADYVIVGAGLFGAVAARQLADAGHEVHVVEGARRIGGLTRTEGHPETGEIYNPHGTHILATSDACVMRYITRFAEFAAHRYTVHAVVGDRHVPMPIGLAAVQACYGDHVTLEQARQIIGSATAGYRGRPVRTVQDAALATFGDRLYEMFVRGHVQKQWGIEPAHLSAEAMTSRFRLNLGDQGYFPQHRWQGVPRGGYTGLLHRLLGRVGISVTTGHSGDPDDLPPFRLGCVHTDPIDEFFGCRLGVMARRHAHIVWTTDESVPDQGTVMLTHPGPAVPYYRVHQPRHLPWNSPAPQGMALLTGYEYGGLPEPDNSDAPTITFVLRNALNAALADEYRHLAAVSMPGHVFAGRGTTFYDDMGTTVRAALDLVAGLLAGNPAARAAAVP